ncbi:MAG: DMT family transporter [Actinomycetota bacterium]
MREKWRYHLFLFAVCWIWGLAFIAMKVLLDEVSFITLNLVRFLLSSLFLLPLVAAGWRRRPRLSVGEWTLVFLAGIAAAYGYHLAITYGETMVPAGTAGLVANITPVFAAVLSRLILYESLGAWKAAGIAMALGGVAVIAVFGGEELGAGRVRGVLFILLAAFSWALYTVILKPLAQERGAFFISAYAIFLGTAALLPLGLTGGGFVAEVKVLSAAGWAWMLFLSLGCTVLGYFLYAKGLEGLGASLSAFYIYLIAPIALFWGWLILGEALNAAVLAGTAMILAGLVSVGWEERKAYSGPGSSP